MSAVPPTRIKDIQHAVEADAGRRQKLAHNLGRRGRAPGEQRFIVGDQGRAQNSCPSISGPARGSVGYALDLCRRQIDVDSWPELFDDARRACSAKAHTQTMAQTEGGR